MDVQARAAAERERYGDDEAPLGSYSAFIAAYSVVFGGALLAARLAGRKLPSPTLGDVALFGVATHKLSRLLAKDKVTAALRAPFSEYEDEGGLLRSRSGPEARGRAGRSASS